MLTSVKRDDAGFYQCVVNNSVAMDAIAMATAYLHVTRPSSRDRDVVDHMRHRPHGRHRGGRLYVVVVVVITHCLLGDLESVI